MNKERSIYADSEYFIGTERRTAAFPRRLSRGRRHRIRKEALISDCRTGMLRREEDLEGFIEIPSLYSHSRD